VYLLLYGFDAVRWMVYAYLATQAFRIMIIVVYAVSCVCDGFYKRLTRE
jgi:hypothetical protein